MDLLPIDVIGSILQYLPLVDILATFSVGVFDIDGKRHLRDSEELWRLLVAIRFSDFGVTEKYKDAFVSVTCLTSSQVEKANLHGILVRRNDLKTLDIIIRKVGRKYYTREILDDIIRDNNLYLLSWYLKVHRRYISYIVKTCVKEGALNLLTFAMRYDVSNKNILGLIYLSIEGKYPDITKYLFEFVPIESLNQYLYKVFEYTIACYRETDIIHLEWSTRLLEERQFRVDYKRHLREICFYANPEGVKFLLKKLSPSSIDDLEVCTCIGLARCNRPVVALLESYRKDIHLKERYRLNMLLGISVLSIATLTFMSFKLAK